MPHYEAGTDDWAQEAAEVFLQQGKGNCYCFAAAFMYCARRLGYQAYVVAGHESKPDNDHAWTMIEENGELTIIDYKTDRVSSDAAVERAQTYSKQLEAYAYAAQRMTGKPVRECVLYFLYSGETVKSSCK